jgi:hypothetical protein
MGCGSVEMDEFTESEDRRLVIKNKLRQYFDGKIVRKDLTKHRRYYLFCGNVEAIRSLIKSQYI